MLRILKPTLVKIGLAVAIAFALWLILSNARVAFVPCLTQPVRVDQPPLEPDWCKLWMLQPGGLAGLNVVMTPWTYLVLGLVFVVLPYLISCLAVGLVRGEHEAA
jgi:hypothetical protein